MGVSEILIFSVIIAYASGSCQIGPHADPVGLASASDSANWHSSCATSLRSQIKMEFEASLQYLLMASYFERDGINLPGFSKLFWEHADEEREHGMFFLNYLRDRGDSHVDNNIIQGDINPTLSKYEWTDGLEALRDALNMEKKVSGAIKNIIDVCSMENNEDYLSGDILTGTWLKEQMEGQRKLAGLINSLTNFRRDHESLGDWLFSNSLLE